MFLLAPAPHALFPVTRCTFRPLLCPGASPSSTARRFTGVYIWKIPYQVLPGAGRVHTSPQPAHPCWLSCSWDPSRHPGCCSCGRAFSTPALGVVMNEHFPVSSLLSISTKGHCPQRRLSFPASCVRIIILWFLLEDPDSCPWLLPPYPFLGDSAH